ncbi:hypothetical protein RHSIM_Rhsim12G0143700 [Rhododendron simsii]|uniref:Uncharacterized protein n=1 Tax=Rhododendron simsii TaxID=118357 RepID=A0A834G2B1_RHOSS|nr:hypothetical protein RHSIM_Rhsim12G0143700 [Rhododendron simsii]
MQVAVKYFKKGGGSAAAGRKWTGRWATELEAEVLAGVNGGKAAEERSACGVQKKNGALDLNAVPEAESNSLVVRRTKDFIGKSSSHLSSFAGAVRWNLGFVRWNGDFDGDTYWVSRNPEVVILDELKAEKFPHYMERTNSYHSTFVLGLIYDTVEKSSQSEDLPTKDEISICLPMVAVIPNCSILVAVGQKMASTPGVSATLFNALAKVGEVVLMN